MNCSISTAGDKKFNSLEYKQLLTFPEKCQLQESFTMLQKWMFISISLKTMNTSIIWRHNHESYPDDFRAKCPSSGQKLSQNTPLEKNAWKRVLTSGWKVTAQIVTKAPLPRLFHHFARKQSSNSPLKLPNFQHTFGPILIQILPQMGELKHGWFTEGKNHPHNSQCIKHKLSTLGTCSLSLPFFWHQVVLCYSTVLHRALFPSLRLKTQTEVSKE